MNENKMKEKLRNICKSTLDMYLTGVIINIQDYDFEWLGYTKDQIDQIKAMGKVCEIFKKSLSDM